MSALQVRLYRQGGFLLLGVLVIATIAAIFVLAPSSLSQTSPSTPVWVVQATDSARGLLSLKGTVRTGVDTAMIWVVQFHLEGAGANQLSQFQPNQPVTLESVTKPQPPVKIPATKSVSPVFTAIPTVGQRLFIRASGIPPVAAVVVNVNGPQSYVAGTPGGAGTPCCKIAAINRQTGIVTGRADSDGRMFTFLVQGTARRAEGPPVPLIDTLTVGQPVWANFTSGQVSLDGKTPCCTMNAVGVSTGGKPAAGGKGPVSTIAACCEITNIASATGDVTAKVRSTGQSFHFEVKDAALLKTLKVGDAVYANFKTHQVSLNGIQPRCQITSVGPVARGLRGKPPFSAIPSPNSPPLTIHDHTLIMQAVIQNRAYLKERTSHHNWQHATRRQLMTGGMLYLLKSPSVSDTTKERVRVYLRALRNAKPAPRTAGDLSFLKDAGAVLRTTNNAPSAVQALSSLQQKYANQPRYLAALNLAKNLANDGASTIYSPAWLQQHAGGAPTTRAEEEAPSCAGGIDDLTGDCIDTGDGGGGGGDPFPNDCDPTTDPTCGGCDPTDPTCGGGGYGSGGGEGGCESWDEDAYGRCPGDPCYFITDPPCGPEAGGPDLGPLPSDLLGCVEGAIHLGPLGCAVVGGADSVQDVIWKP